MCIYRWRKADFYTTEYNILNSSEFGEVWYCWWLWDLLLTLTSKLYNRVSMPILMTSRPLSSQFRWRNYSEIFSRIHCVFKFLLLWNVGLKLIFEPWILSSYEIFVSKSPFKQIDWFCTRYLIDSMRKFLIKRMSFRY